MRAVAKLPPLCEKIGFPSQIYMSVFLKAGVSSVFNVIKICEAIPPSYTCSMAAGIITLHGSERRPSNRNTAIFLPARRRPRAPEATRTP